MVPPNSYSTFRYFVIANNYGLSVYYDDDTTCTASDEKHRIEVETDENVFHIFGKPMNFIKSHRHMLKPATIGMIYI